MDSEVAFPAGVDARDNNIDSVFGVELFADASHAVSSWHADVLKSPSDHTGSRREIEVMRGFHLETKIFTGRF